VFRSFIKTKDWPQSRHERKGKRKEGIEFLALGPFKNGWHGRLARAFWPKKCTGETPMPPYSKYPFCFAFFVSSRPYLIIYPNSRDD